MRAVGFYIIGADGSTVKAIRTEDVDRIDAVMTSDQGREDDRTNIFGVPYQRPDRDQAVVQYQNRSMHKLHIAEWHGAEFERLEGELRTDAFFQFGDEPFLPAQAHADGAMVQLAASFDAFACAVAHRYGIDERDPDRASFGGPWWNPRLIEAAEPDLANLMTSISRDPNFEGLAFYRNLAAHRGVVGERQRGGSVEEVGDEGVRFVLPDWLPIEAPDHPSYSVRPILERYLKWGRHAIAGLNALASSVWNMEDESEGELVLRDEMFVEPLPRAEDKARVPEESDIRAITEEDLAPQLGECRGWFEWGSHTFDGPTVPPAWFVRCGDRDPVSLAATNLTIDELRNWLDANFNDNAKTKALLWHYRPEDSPTDEGRVLAPRIRR